MQDAEITTREAADLLDVSAAALAKLLEDGALPFRSVGADRVLRVAEVLAYRERRATQAAALDGLVAENQRAGLYEE